MGESFTETSALEMRIFLTVRAIKQQYSLLSEGGGFLSQVVFKKRPDSNLSEIPAFGRHWITRPPSRVMMAECRVEYGTMG